MKVHLGDLTLDSDTRQLRRGAIEVRISPKAFELLAILLDARPRALAKTDLQQRLWPNAYVSESNLAGLVAEIRRAIGDDARTPRFVRTVQRFGYAFAGDVSVATSASAVALRCWLVYRDRQWPLPDGEHMLGRGAEPGAIDSDTVSRRHARILVSRGRGNDRGSGEQERDVREGRTCQIAPGIERWR
jgi:DNA-binding winged helix-turn-helix (wHTH) protein